MPLIAGAYAAPGTGPLDLSRIEAMCSYMRGLGYQVHSTEPSEHIALAACFAPHEAGDASHGFPMKRIGAAAYFGPVRLYGQSASSSGEIGDPYGTAAQFIAKFGPEGAGALNGDFVLGTYDDGTKTLRLFRDHFGIASLYYLSHGAHLYFSSWITPLLRVSDEALELDMVSLCSYLMNGSPVRDGTFYRNIRALLPASYIEAGPQPGLRIRRYWRPATGRFAAGVPEHDLMEAFRERLVKSVCSRIPKAGPVGFLLSGGLDSSTIAAIACKEFPEREFVSRTSALPAGHPGPETDERTYVETLRQRYPNLAADYMDGSGVQLLSLSAAAPTQLAGPLLNPYFQGDRRMLDELSGGPVLSGDGGDSCLSSFLESFLLNRLLSGDFTNAAAEFRRLRKLYGLSPAAIGRQRILARLVPISLQKLRWNLLGTDWTRSTALTRQAFDTFGIKANVIDRNLAFNLRTCIGPSEEQRRELEALSQSNQILSFDEQLPGQRNDLRFPLLDPRLIEAVLDMPATSKANANEDRALIRSAARDYLPPRILNRTDKGYGAPAYRMCLARSKAGLTEAFSIFSKNDLWRYLVDEKKLALGLAELERPFSNEDGEMALVLRLSRPFELGRFLVAHAAHSRSNPSRPR